MTESLVIYASHSCAWEISGETSGKQPFGRPRKRRKDNIKWHHREIIGEDRKWIDVFRIVFSGKL